MERGACWKISGDAVNIQPPISETDLETLQRETFDYFTHEANPANGLIIDKTEAGWPASIAATGLALAAYPVGVERGFWPRSAAVERTLTTLRFFWNSPQGPEPDATQIIVQRGVIIRTELLMNWDGGGDRVGIAVKLIGHRRGVIPMPSWS